MNLEQYSPGSWKRAKVPGYGRKKSPAMRGLFEFRDDSRGDQTSIYVGRKLRIIEELGVDRPPPAAAGLGIVGNRVQNTALDLPAQERELRPTVPRASTTPGTILLVEALA